jgi:hypothetical protein
MSMKRKPGYCREPLEMATNSESLNILLSQTENIDWKIQ